MRRLSILIAAFLAGCGTPAPPGNESAPNGSAAVEAPSIPPALDAGSPRAEVIPEPFRGVYDRSLEGCGAPSEYRLTVTAGELRFHESIGAVRRVAIEGPDTVRITADFQGEGQSWSADHQLRLSGAGSDLTVTANGTSTLRVRCGSIADTVSQPQWQGAANGEGDALFLANPAGGRLLTLFCPADSSDLVVNVPARSAIGSEERMSFGAGGTVVVLVADPNGDPGRGGITGRGPLPDELSAILAMEEGISVSYGSQTSGPHGPPPAALTRAFLAGCRD